MATWQVVLAIVAVLLPIVLMLDLWGDERLSFRGQPVRRDWERQIHHPTSDDDEH